MKKGDVVAAFKTLPTGQPVSHVTLGRGQAIQRDKIFVAQGQTVSTQLSTTDAAALKSVADKCAVLLTGARLHQERQTVLQL